MRLTVREFDQLVDGALWREERLRELVGWHAMHVMSMEGKTSKSPIELDKLLGRPPVPGPRWQPPEPIFQPAPIPRPAPLARRPVLPTLPALAPPPATAPVDPIRLRLEDLVRRGMAVRVQ